MASHEKNRIALSSVIAAIFLTGLKLVVGLTTNSLGILSEAAHSGLDLVAALMTLFAVRISDRPADESHHYGHGKFEGVSALLQVFLLLATCGYIIYEAVERIGGKIAHVDANLYAFGVMAISIGVDISRSRALYKVARKYRSQALEADALHFASDLWSSAVVIIGLVTTRFLDIPVADSVAALLVAVLVTIVSFRLGARTMNVLLDKAPPGVQRKIEMLVSQVQGMERLDSLRVRSAGAKTFVDMRLTLDSGLSFQEAHRIASWIERKVSEIIPGADAIVHVNPSKKTPSKPLSKEDISGILTEHQDLFVGYHDLNIVHHQDQYVVTLHLLMGADSHLEEAHKVCDHLERDIKQLFPGASVTIHLEPACPADKERR